MAMALKHHVLLLGAQGYTNPLTVSFRSRSHIHSDIKYFSVSDADKLALCMILLEMKATQDTFSR